MMYFKRPRGFYDITGYDFQKFEDTCTKISNIVKSYGYDGISTPIVEDKKLFIDSSGSDSDIAKELYYISGDEYVLRPEGTAPVIRYIVENNISGVQKLYYYGPMFRHDNPQHGRQRQFHQFGIEFISPQSSSEYLCDFEIIEIAKQILDQIIGSDQYTLYVNSIGTIEERKVYIELLSQYFEKNKSKLHPSNVSRINSNPLRILDSKYDDRNIIEAAPKITNILSESSLISLKNILSKINNVYHNEYLVRGLDYYKGLVFECKPGNEFSQNTILGGGRYDNILNTNIYGVGFALGIERLLMIRQEIKKNNKIVVSMEDETGLFYLISEIRKKGIIVKTIYDSLKRNIKEANKEGVQYFLFLDKNDKSKIVIKDMNTSAEEIFYTSDIETIYNRII